MDGYIGSALSALFGAIVGGGITFFLNKQQFKHQISVLREQNKTEYMAEEAVRHYLNHENYTDRSFEIIQKHLGGFEPEELRKILVRAGAIRIYRDDGSEWWRLLSRLNEYNKKKSASHD